MGEYLSQMSFLLFTSKLEKMHNILLKIIQMYMKYYIY